ncbi:MAG: Uma2 family endonuclease [Chloroflexota bacterium]
MAITEQLAAADSGGGARITFEEFLALDTETACAEWVGGEVIAMSPVGLKHQLIASFLHTLIVNFLDRRPLGTAVFAPFVMHLADQQRGREPDILFVAAAHTDRFRDNYLDGPADLAVEIVSPESGARDRGDKFAEYEQAGVAEYWIIDPIRVDASFYQLQGNGTYRRIAPNADGWYHSRVLDGFRLRPSWLWEDPLPSVSAVGAQIAG